MPYTGQPKEQDHVDHFSSFKSVAPFPKGLSDDTSQNKISYPVQLLIKFLLSSLKSKNLTVL